MLLHSTGGGGRKWCRTRSELRICSRQPQGCSAGGQGVGAPKDSGCSPGSPRRCWPCCWGERPSGGWTATCKRVYPIFPVYPVFQVHLLNALLLPSVPGTVKWPSSVVVLPSSVLPAPCS